MAAASEVKLRIAVEGAEASRQAIDGVSKNLNALSKNAEQASKAGQSWRGLAADFAHVGQSLTFIKASMDSTIGTIAAVGGALIQAQQAGEKLKNTLDYSVGAAKVASEIEYLRTVTRNLGIDYSTSAAAYGKFSAAVKGTGISAAQTKTIFEGVAGASTKMGLSADEAQGAFLALSQMASKGVVSAEELRGQLGERLPGAMRIAAQAMGVTDREFNKLLETGQIMASDFLPKFGQALKDNFQGPVNGLTQEINRLNSAWDQWKQALADADGGGFKPITNGLNESAAAMRTLGNEAGIVQKLLVAIGGFEAGAIGAGKFDTAKIQQDAMAKLEMVVKGRRNMEGRYLNYLEQESLRDLIRQEQALRDQLLELAVQKGKGVDIKPNLKDEFEAQTAKRKAAFDSYMKEVQSEKDKQIAAENARFTALTAIIGVGGKQYEAALAEHNRTIAEINKKGASGTTNNNASQAFAAEIKLAQDAAKTQVEIIQEKVKQQVISEREGIDQTLAAQNAGFVAQAAALKSQLAKTSDSGERAKLKQEIIALGNDAAVAAAKAETGIQKIEDASLKAQQDYMAGLGNETASLIAKADAAEYEMSLIGKTAEQIAVLTEKRYNEQIAVQQANIDRLQGIPGSEAEISLIQEKINALERLKGVEITQPRLREQAREWERFTSDIERSLTDALMRSFESGESFGDAFINNLKNTLKSAALKLAIQTTIGTTGSLANGAINAVLGTSGSNGGGTDYLGLANTASRGYSLYSGATAAYTAYAAEGALTGSEAATAAWAYLQSGEFGTALGVALKGALGTTGTAVTGASTAPVAVNSWTSLAPTQTTTAAEAALTTEAAGTGLGAWSSALGYAGLVVAAGMLIGKLVDNGQTEYKGTNLTGTFGDNGFGDGTLSDKWYRDGGWLHTEKDWTVNTPLNASKEMIEANDNLSLSRFRQDIQVPDFSTGDISDPAAEAAARAAAEAAAKPIQDALIASEQERLQSIQALMDALYTDTKAGMVKVGEAFEDSTFSEKLKAFTFSINESFETLTLAGVGEKLTEAMGKALLPSVATIKTQSVDLANSLKTSLEQATASGDSGAAEALKAKIAQLEAVGAESWTATFGRMMAETQAVAGVLDLFGTTLAETFGQNNMDGILMMSDNLTQLFGGIDAMNSSVNAYYENFYSQEEKTARSWEVMGKSFEALNLTLPTTREGFRDLVDGLDLNTLAGQATFKSLMDLQSGFANLVPALEDATTTTEALAAAAKALADWKTDTLTRFAQAKTVEQAAQEVNASGLYGAPGQLMTNMDLSGFNAAIAGVVANANDATKTLVDGQMGNLEIIQSYLADLEEAAAQAAIAVAELTKSLQDEGAALGIELLRAQGDEQGALAAERTIAIDGYNAEQIALYDANAATRAYINALGEEAAEKDRIAGERKGLQDEYDTLTMTSAQLLNKQRDALDESNRGLFDQISAIKAANTAMADLAQQIESIGGARTNISNAKQDVVAQMSTFDAPAYYEAQKAILAAQFSSAGSTTQKLDIAGKWQDTITNGMQAQITALDKARDIRIKALQDESTLAEENAAQAKQTAESMASALASIADYANGLKTGNLSTLSPEDKLAAAGSEYQRLLSAAQGGDSDAAGKLTGASDNYLSLAKDYYASTDAYSNIFASVEQSLSALGSQASVYEQIAATALSTYDLVSATAAADAEYQASVLAIQQASVDQFTALDTKLGEYQSQQEFRLDEQIIQLNLLNVKNEAIGDKITASQNAITAGLSRVASAQDRQAAILAQITALLAQANALAAQTATATNKTASASELAGAV